MKQATAKMNENLRSADFLSSLTLVSGTSGLEVRTPRLINANSNSQLKLFSKELSHETCHPGYL